MFPRFRTIRKARLLSVVLAAVVLAFCVFGTSGFARMRLALAQEIAQAQTDSQENQLSAAQQERAKLEADLARLEAEIAVKQKELASQKGQSASISNEIKIINTQISQAKLKIQSKNLAISKLSKDISTKESTIDTLEERLQKERASLAQMIRQTHHIDETPFVYVALGNESVSEFYRDLDSFETLKRSVKISLDQVREIRDNTEAEKKDLEKKHDQELDVKYELESVKKTIERSEKEKQALLSASKSKEKTISDVIADRQAEVNRIKARLFSFAGGTAAIRFDAALQFAEEAQSKTNVEPAFVLAILTQESNLGANVGKCYLTNPDTGAGVGVSNGRTYTNVMKPTRDVKPFLALSAELGFDPYRQVVSCPIAGVAGYGGAMGPAQFIPSTWKTVQDRVAAARGVGIANPWNAGDAIMASAMYLSDLGGTGSSSAAQLRAACKYYGTGGSTCSYGRSVMNHKAKIQADINYLEEYGVSRR